MTFTQKSFTSEALVNPIVLNFCFSQYIYCHSSSYTELKTARAQVNFFTCAVNVLRESKILKQRDLLEPQK